MEGSGDAFRHSRSRSPSVFVSYTKSNQESALKLFGDLRRHGAEPWLDIFDLLPGQRFRSVISEVIRKSDYFIALISERSLEHRGMVQGELREALDVLQNVPHGHIFLIPARLDDCQPVHPELGQLQWVDMFPAWDAGLERILKAMHLGATQLTDLDLYIRDNIDTTLFPTEPTWEERFRVVHTHTGREDIAYVIWNMSERRLYKYFLPLYGVRWYGRFKLSQNDIARTKKVLREQYGATEL